MVDFCGEDELGYERSRTRFAASAGLEMDEAYRRAHLPLLGTTDDLVLDAPAAEPVPLTRK